MVLPGRHQVTKAYTARLATRVTTSVDTRLRQLALVSRRRISHVLDDVLDAALPSAEDLSAQLARRASPSQERHVPR
jgi:hypothetical protein